MPGADVASGATSGTILDSDFGAKAEQPDADMVQKVSAYGFAMRCPVLTLVMPVEIKKGSIEGRLCAAIPDVIVYVRPSVGQHMMSPVMLLGSPLWRRQRQREGRVLRICSVNQTFMVVSADERCLEARYKVPGTIELDTGGFTPRPRAETQEPRCLALSVLFLWHSLCGERCPLTSLLTGEKVDYDVYMPTHVQGPNTEFLKSRSPAFLKKGRIRSNECLQSMVHPEVRPEP
eukprot:1852889-Rhodomonas_salina.2